MVQLFILIQIKIPRYIHNMKLTRKPRGNICLLLRNYFGKKLQAHPDEKIDFEAILIAMSDRLDLSFFGFILVRFHSSVPKVSMLAESKILNCRLRVSEPIRGCENYYVKLNAGALLRL